MGKLGIFISLILFCWGAFFADGANAVNGYFLALDFMWVWCWIWIGLIGLVAVLSFFGVLSSVSTGIGELFLALLGASGIAGIIAVLAIITRAVVLLGIWLLLHAGARDAVNFNGFHNGKLIAGVILLSIGIRWSRSKRKQVAKSKNWRTRY